MAEQVKSSSLYYRRRMGTAPAGFSNTKPRRAGDCGHSLAGRRGHGFPTQDGKGLYCSLACLTKRHGKHA